MPSTELFMLWWWLWIIFILRKVFLPLIFWGGSRIVCSLQLINVFGSFWWRVITMRTLLWPLVWWGEFALTKRLSKGEGPSRQQRIPATTAVLKSLCRSFKDFWSWPLGSHWVHECRICSPLLGAAGLGACAFSRCSKFWCGQPKSGLEAFQKMGWLRSSCFASSFFSSWWTCWQGQSL